MAKYAYPAILTREADGTFSVSFPDLPNCFTVGNDLQHALEMANDALCLTLYDAEERQRDIPAASDLRQIQASTSEIVTLVACDTVEYRKYFDNKAVKKTLTIPNWLNTLAERQGVNFSAVLQMALRRELNIE